jgi:hypothetical protein
MTKIWDLSSARVEVKASQRPSGDQPGPEEGFLLRVSWIVRPVGTSASQIYVT